MKIQAYYVTLMACLSVAAAAQGQANYAPPTPEQEARSRQQWALDQAAAKSLHAGYYVQAEAQARQALSLGQDSGVAEEVLAASLYAQGQDREALQEYHKMVDVGSGFARVRIPYALLLLKAGRWAEAVAAYNYEPSQPRAEHEGVQWADGRFSPDVPEPKAFAVALHLARGLGYSDGARDWAGETQNTEAMTEFEKALALDPNSARANFFYGYGWKRLSPDERSKYGTEQQARAALLKAVKFGKGDVKAAAQKELRVAMNVKENAK